MKSTRSSGLGPEYPGSSLACTLLRRSQFGSDRVGGRLVSSRELAAHGYMNGMLHGHGPHMGAQGEVTRGRTPSILSGASGLRCAHVQACARRATQAWRRAWRAWDVRMK